MIDDRIQLIKRILDCSGSLFHNVSPTRNQAWLTVNLTMPQLKALMCVASNNGAPSGHIARRLGPLARINHRISLGNRPLKG